MPDWLPPPPFARPSVLLLALPVAWAFVRFGRTGDRRTDALRLVVAGLLVAAAAGPVWDRSGEGLDVVLVLDRSRSMPASAADLRELAASVEAARGEGDRVGVVTFGGTAAVERTPAEAAVLGEFARPVDADGTDLNAALHLALDLADPRRPARVVVLSDGESNGPDPRDAARRARAAGVPVDVRPFPAARAGDAAVTALTVPDSAAPGEPVAVGVTLFSPEPAAGTLSLSRREPGGAAVPIGKRRVALPAGASRVRFRDAAPANGFHVYVAELSVPGDGRRGNDRGEAGLRVDAPRRALVLTAADGETSAMSGEALAAAFAAAGIPTDVRPAAEAALTQDSLDGYGLVALADVPADALGRRKLARLGQFVTDLGGGLLTTGGRRSYAAGGYAESPLEPLLPVDLDPRDDADGERTAIVVALDRSGSMAVPAGGGRTKMDLANDGAAAVLAVLNRGDRAAVLAVDTAAEAFLPLTELGEPGGKTASRAASRARSIRSSGGGIFIDAALAAAADELEPAADLASKHVLVFADAADAESPGDYQIPLDRLRALGATVSVIGLGTRADPDAWLLEEIAAAGGGTVRFTDDPQELPRLFAQDALAVTTDTFLAAESPAGIPAEFAPGAALVGELGGGVFPGVGGYNLCGEAEGAGVTVRTRDEYAAPLGAAWYRGAGRSAALTFPVAGPDAGPAGAWAGLPDFLATHGRWLLGGGGTGGAFVTGRVVGRTAEVTVELDPAAAGEGGTVPELVVVPPADDPGGLTERDGGEPFAAELRWDGPAELSASFPLDRVGTYRTLLRWPGGRGERGPAVSLPYSPEFLPRAGLPPGAAALAEVAAVAGGVTRTDLTTVFRDPPPRPAPAAAWGWFAAAAVVLLLVEIAGRRWAWALPWRAGDELVAAPRTRDRRAVRTAPVVREAPPPPKPAVPTRPAATADDVFGAAKARAGRRR